ncbi:MAG TPA: iron-containing alcohol dehydrogenase [Verrucomicrobiae bacterium]|nr:iron-containing alcohol dehydrogenase [Verrucomicrobiae bacterium]
MIPEFDFATATKIVFGTGRLKDLGALAKPLGSRALLVTGRNASRAEPTISALQRQGITCTTLTTDGEPDIESVSRGVDQAKKNRSDLVISFGGGSAIDAGKAIAAMITNDGELLDYLEVIGKGKSLEKASAPFIAIPTTAGTGSEVTRNSVLASPQHRVKVSLRSALMLPRIALVDPETTWDLPPATTASTGLDALTQVVEPYVCNRANPMTDALCVEAIGRAARSLSVAFEDGHNKNAREDMCVASLFGGLALANAGLGAVHGFAGPIGGMFPAPHGAVCAVLLPHVMRANIDALRLRQPGSHILGRYETVARLLTANPLAKADDGPQWVLKLVQKLGIPPLSAYGVTREAIGDIVAKSAKASSMKANPIVLTNEELSRILETAL